MALMQLTIVPLGTGTPSVGQEVTEILTSLKREGIPFTLTDMGTIVEGTAPQLLELAARLHEQTFSEKIQRVVTHITLDDRRDKKVHLGDKTASVEKGIAAS